MDGFSSQQLEDKIAAATDRMRQAFLNDYTKESFELLTPGNVPPDVRAIAFALSLHLLTEGDAARPEPITEAANDAATRLGFVVGGKTHYDSTPNSPLVKLANGASSTVAYRASQRVIDRTDSCSEFSRHSEKLP